MNKLIFSQLQDDADFLLAYSQTDDNSDLWSSRAAEALRKFVRPDDKIDTDLISQFRRNQLFINEVPAYGTGVRDWVAGHRRADRVLLKERFTVMEKEGDLPFLEKYPLQLAGNPHVMEIDGYRFNKRWSNNIRYLKLTSEHLGENLRASPSTVMDIGGGYGAYLWLLKQEIPSSSPVLVEFPEQLLLAKYFLQLSSPDARINTLKEVYERKSLDREFFEEFDFTLVPIDCFDKVTAGSVDLVTNFFSFGEMNEHWFDTYRNSKVFTEASYLFTINRFFSFPTYGTDINILRYRLNEYGKKHFGVSPYEQYFMRGKWKFFVEKLPYTSQFFEFIGDRTH